MVIFFQNLNEIKIFLSLKDATAALNNENFVSYAVESEDICFLSARGLCISDS